MKWEDRTFKTERDFCTVQEIISLELTVSKYCGDFASDSRKDGSAVFLLMPRPCSDVTWDERRITEEMQVLLLL